ncbi:MAG: PD-(D/E)XK nuclease family protein [Pseudomonadales bacterium]
MQNEPTAHDAELSALTKYDLILTPNQRLSQELHNRYDEIQSSAGLRSWKPLPVLSISNWLLQLWSSAVVADHEPCNGLHVLNADEELELWRQALALGFDGNLLANESAAQQLMQASNILSNWNQELDTQLRSTFGYSDDHAFFIRCYDHFVALCEEHQSISAAKIAAVLGKLPALFSGQVLLYKFEEVVPVHLSLLSMWSLEYAVVKHTAHSLNSLEVSRPLAYQFSTQRQELLAAAQWAKDIVQTRSDASIAIIVPNLSSCLSLVNDTFSQVFEPAAELPEAIRRVAEFNVSAGMALADMPLVEHALVMLKLNTGSLPVEALSMFLNSPFLSAVNDDNDGARADLEFSLRNYRSRGVSLQTILYEASIESASGGPRCPALAQAINSFRQIIAGKPRRTVCKWLEIFQRQLHSCGWPGRRILDSVEYQQLQHWNEVLRNTEKLGAIKFTAHKLITASQCIELLSRVCREHVFQPQSVACRVQVLGLLEGAGLRFTHTWLVGVSAPHWPAVAKPSPFIPIALQREQRMPHCDADRELQFSGKLFSNYRTHTEHLVLSYCDRDGDSPVAPSSFLVANADHISTYEVAEPFDIANPQYREPYLLDSNLAVGESEVVSAVTSIFEDQAACGFKAFARHRLRLRDFEEPGLGLDGRDRGMLLHDSMEAIWKMLGGSTVLKQQSANALDALIREAVSQAMASAAKKLKFRDAELFLELERERLIELITDWLRLEAQREDFEVVEFEVALLTNIASREATLRIDRVDKLSDGRLVLLEYKTGRVSEAALLNDPPLAPQLPLYLDRYVSSTDLQAAGGALCRIDTHEPAWLGYGAGKQQNLPKKVAQASKTQPEWLELKAQWKRGLEYIENSFLNGEVKALPVQGEQTCRLCDYATICRIGLNNMRPQEHPAKSRILSK